MKARFGEAARELVRRSLASLVVIVIKGNVDLTVRSFGQLVELQRGELVPDAACGVAKTRLPKHGKIEESFDEYSGGMIADRVPRNQTGFRTRQQPVRKSSPGTASIEVDDMTLLTAWKH